MARRTRPEPTKVFPLNIDIPREEAIALAVLAMETALTSYRRKRIQWSTTMLRTRRDIGIALEHEHGLRHWVQDARIRRANRLMKRR
jgi:hypothetical protein